jgi:hypothetical protein
MKRRQLKKQFIKQTSVKKKNNTNPQWDEDLSFDIPCSPEQLEAYILRVEVYDWDRTHNTLMGYFSLQMPEVIEAISNDDEGVSEAFLEEDMSGGDSGLGGQEENSDGGVWYTLMNKVSTESTGAKALGAAKNLFRRHEDLDDEEQVLPELTHLSLWS